MQTLKTLKRSVLHYFRIAEVDELVLTHNSRLQARRGDAIITGIDGEVFLIQANKFLATYDILSNGQCRKKPSEVLAIHFDVPFEVIVAWQENPLEGHVGDWLIQYSEGNFDIVDEISFQKSFDILGASYKQIDIDSPNIRIKEHSASASTASEKLQNCLLGNHPAVLKFHPNTIYLIGEIALYQPLSDGHPSDIWYQAKITQIRDNGYLELEPVISSCVSTLVNSIRG